MKKNQQRINVNIIDEKTGKTKYIKSVLVTMEVGRTIFHEPMTIKKGESYSIPVKVI